MRVERQEPYQENNEESAQRDAVLRKWSEAEHSVNDVRAERVRVMKFGGSVLTSAENLLLVAGHVVDTARSERVAVVVSALRGVTDRLYSVTRALRMRDVPTALFEAAEISRLHLHVGHELYAGAEQEFQLRLELAELAHELDLVVRRAGEGQSPAEMTDEVVSFGERWSARMFAAALRKLDAHAEALDAFEFIVTNGDREDPQPRLGESYPKIRESLHRHFDANTIPVVTGFVAATPEGRITTLGRNSSDFSAAIVACALGAHDLTIWTSVDGFFDADPRRNADAQFLARLSYEEALDLSRRGAKVVHPKAFDFLMQERIPLLVRNAARPERPGTWVGDAEPGAPR
ncbi:MAG: aspartate kinase [Candidatus Acidiferrales bacterium]